MAVAALTAAVTLTSSWLASQNSLRQVEIQTRSEREATIRAERRDAYSRLLADLNAIQPAVDGCWDLDGRPPEWDPHEVVYPTLEAAFRDLGTVQLIGTTEASDIATYAYDDARFLADECERYRLSLAEAPGTEGPDGPLEESWRAIEIGMLLQQSSAALMSEAFRADLLPTSDDATMTELRSTVDDLRRQIQEMYPGADGD